MGDTRVNTKDLIVRISIRISLLNCNPFLKRVMKSGSHTTIEVSLRQKMHKYINV